VKPRAVSALSAGDNVAAKRNGEENDGVDEAKKACSYGETSRNNREELAAWRRRGCDIIGSAVKRRGKQALFVFCGMGVARRRRPQSA